MTTIASGRASSSPFVRKMTSQLMPLANPDSRSVLLCFLCATDHLVIG